MRLATFRSFVFIPRRPLLFSRCAACEERGKGLRVINSYIRGEDYVIRMVAENSRLETTLSEEPLGGGQLSSRCVAECGARKLI